MLPAARRPTKSSAVAVSLEDPRLLDPRLVAERRGNSSCCNHFVKRRGLTVLLCVALLAGQTVIGFIIFAGHDGAGNLQRRPLFTSAQHSPDDAPAAAIQGVQKSSTDVSIFSHNIAAAEDDEPIITSTVWPEKSPSPPSAVAARSPADSSRR